MLDWGEGPPRGPSIQMTTSPNCQKTHKNIRYHQNPDLFTRAQLVCFVIIGSICIQTRTYQTIKAEGMLSLRNAGILRRASEENPVHVFEQEEENLTYSANNTTLIQYEILLAKAAPLIPRPDLNTKTQQSGKCSKEATAALNIIGKTMFWVCKNLKIE